MELLRKQVYHGISLDELVLAYPIQMGAPPAESLKFHIQNRVLELTEVRTDKFQAESKIHDAVLGWQNHLAEGNSSFRAG